MKSKIHPDSHRDKIQKSRIKNQVERSEIPPLRETENYKLKSNHYE